MRRNLGRYVGKKEGHKRAEEAENEGLGDTYCFVAIDRKTKVVINSVESVKVVPIIGNPDPRRICTSIVERQNLTIRMQVRAHDAPNERLQQEMGEPLGCALLALRFLQLCRVHKALRVTPAMQAGITEMCGQLRNY